MDDWYETIQLPISFDEFLTLPTNPAYKYEYFDGHALLTPRPKAYHAVLDLVPGNVSNVAESRSRRSYPLRPLDEGDWDYLPALFAASFARVQPFSALDEERRLQAARQCLAKTRGGGDGPIVVGASWVAVREDDDRPVAAALVTLQPREPEDHEPVDDESDAHPTDPHLTWIFVPPLLARHGIGSTLLATVSASLLELGHDRLASTFLLGNESSTLWHWRSGFRLLGFGRFPRRLRQWWDTPT